MIQRCTCSQVGRVANQAEMPPAASTISRLTLKLIADLGGAQHHALRQHVAALRVDELRQQRDVEDRDLRVQECGQEAHGEQLAGPVGLEVAPRPQRRAGAGPHRGPGHPQQVAGAGQLHRLIGQRHGEHQRGEADGGGQHVAEQAQHHAGQRDRPGQPTLQDRARQQVDHVRPGGADHAERDQGKAGQAGGADDHHRVPRQKRSGASRPASPSSNRNLARRARFSPSPAGSRPRPRGGTPARPGWWRADCTGPSRPWTRPAS